VAQQFFGRRQRLRRSPRRSGCLRRSMLSRRVHSSIPRRRAVEGPWRRRRSFFPHREVFGNEVMVLDDLDHGVEQENKQKPNAKTPYLACQMSERKFFGRVAERTRPKS
jgi:hypothetical protein